MARENLEGRFWFNNKKPILYIVANEMINASADDFEIVDVNRNTDIEEIISIIRHKPIDALYTDIVNFDLFRAAIVAGIVLYIPKEVEGMKTWKCNKFGTTVYTIGGIRKSVPKQLVKRGVDVLGGLVGTGIFAMSYPFVALAIKREDGGPVLFKQKRVTYDGREFEMYKYRSMKPNADAIKQRMLDQNEMQGKYMFKMEDDPRITKVGKFIRKTSIDELPQFINVLKGDMSLVGTRAPISSEVANYKARHKQRLTMKTGLSGVWQTSGRNKITDFEDVVDLDKKYNQSDSLAEYSNILLKTLSSVMKKDGE